MLPLLGTLPLARAIVLLPANVQFDVTDKTVETLQNNSAKWVGQYNRVRDLCVCTCVRYKKLNICYRLPTNDKTHNKIQNENVLRLRFVEFPIVQKCDL